MIENIYYRGDALNKKNKQTSAGKTTLEQLIKDIDCADRGTKLGIEHLVSVSSLL